MLELDDYVTVLAMTSDRHVLFVRQYRPVVGGQTLELPSGHVDGHESPEEAARRELKEETGFVADRLELLGVLIPDVGRLANRMWCYFAGDVRPGADPGSPEAGIELVPLPEHEALSCATDGTIDHALNLSVLFLALSKRKLALA